MGPIEQIFFTIGIMITLIGLARGYIRELGSTLIILSALFLLTFFQSRILAALKLVDGGQCTDTSCNGLYFLIFAGLFAVMVFAGYGQTLYISGSPIDQPGKFLLDIAVGALNGYLISGTIWYYLDRFDYPFRNLTGFQSPLTTEAQKMLQYLPPNLFDNPVYWIVPVIILLILSVRG